MLDVIKASEGPRRSDIHGEHWRHLESVPGCHALCKVSQVVEDMLRELTIEDIEEKSLQSRRPFARCFIGASVAA